MYAVTDDVHMFTTHLLLLFNVDVSIANLMLSFDIDFVQILCDLSCQS